MEILGEETIARLKEVEEYEEEAAPEYLRVHERKERNGATP